MKPPSSGLVIRGLTSPKPKVSEFVKDAGTAALFGGAVGLGGAAVGGLATRLASRRANELPKRIINEIAEGQGDIRTTPTQQKLLSKSEKNIVEEVVGTKAADKLKKALASGNKPKTVAAAEKRLEEADRVRDAYLSEAKAGLPRLERITESVGKKLEAGYKAFERAGKADINPVNFWYRFQADAAKAAAKGKGQEARALEALGDMWERTVRDAGGKADVKMIRGFTTEIQKVSQHLP